jgi:hypothetical protein
MASKKTTLTISDFRSMATEWENWRELFSPSGTMATVKPLGANTTKALVAVTRQKVVWKLAVSVAAYVYLENARKPTKRLAAADVVSLTESLKQNTWDTQYPGFRETAVNVSQVPFVSLKRASPRLAKLLETHTTIAADAIPIIDFCRQLHPNDDDAFLKCVTGAGGG